MEDVERHLAVAVAVDGRGRLLVDRKTRAPLSTEFADAWPQDAAAALLVARVGVTVPRSRMAATHLDLGGEEYAHFLWLTLRADELAAIPDELAWVAADDLAGDPTLVADSPVRSEVLRLAFGWTEPSTRYAPAIPPKIDPTAVDWADPHVRVAALDAMAGSELDLASGMVGDYEVTVGGGDDGLYMLTAGGPDGALNALDPDAGDGQVDIRVGGEVVPLPEAYGLSRELVETSLDQLCSGDTSGPGWELDAG